MRAKKTVTALVGALILCCYAEPAHADPKRWELDGSKCEPVNADCTCAGFTTPLIAGQDIPAGTVNVTNSGDNLVITINTDEPWLLTKTHIYAGTRYRSNGGGNPPPGQFPYFGYFDPPVTSYTEVIPLEDLKLKSDESVIVIMVHTNVIQLDADGCEEIVHHTAWAYGPIEHGGSRWGWSFCFQLLDADSTELIGVPADTTGECGNLPEPPEVTAQSGCGGETVDVPVVFDETYSCNLVTRTWTAMCGASATAEQHIEVTDDVAPELTVPEGIVLECDAEMGPPDTCPGGTGSATATDNCDPNPVITYVDVETPGDCPQEKTIARTWTAKDACGNWDSEVQMIEIVDTTAPEFELVSQDKTVECDGLGNLAAMNHWLNYPTASDNCGIANVTNDYSGLSDGCGVTGSTVVTWTAMDECGNSAEHKATFTVVDTTPPEFELVSQDKTVECDGLGNLTAMNDWLDYPTASDHCGTVSITNDYSGLSDGCGATGSAVVTWTAMDECGNSVEYSATFTIEDTTPPEHELTVQDNMSVECDGEGNETDFNAWMAGVFASDTCGDVVLTNDYDGMLDGCGASGSVTVTWTATDECMNEATTSLAFTIVDETAPDLTVPENLTVECDGNGNQAEIETWLAGATAEDGCGTVQITNDMDGAPTACGTPSETLVTWTATDACGNTSTGQATCTIVDTTLPVLTVPDDLLFDCNAEEVVIGEYGDATATDLCDPAPTITLEETQSNGSCGNTMVLTRTFTATDACGNSVSDVQTITVGDATPPTIEASIEHRSFKNRGYLWPNNHKLEDILLTVSATDNCGDDADIVIDVHMFADEDEMADTGSGTTSPDAKFDPLRLRMERVATSAGGDGRVYMIVVTATDCAGNVGYKCLTAAVPIDQSQVNIDNVFVQAAAAEAECDQFADYVLGNVQTIPLGFYVVGVGPEIGGKQ